MAGSIRHISQIGFGHADGKDRTTQLGGANFIISVILEMIKINIKGFIYDRVWFGWCYSSFGWYRGTNTDIHWKIVVMPRDLWYQE